MPVQYSPPARQARSQARTQAVLTPTPRVPLDSCHSHGDRAWNYQSLPIDTLPTPNQQGGFMEDPPNTVLNLNTAQYRQNANTGLTKYMPVLNTGTNTFIGYTNTCLYLKYIFLHHKVMGSQHSNSKMALFHIYQPPFTHLGVFPPVN
ncbi:hypothetical protein O181_080992 [Austropuccinia psidii MF-1]|uniref:Uncharacterized protein n=1 Tax=Austropuccinia psidii MF-1 TaxID=1389203 RepID=A0A9Q3FPW4_9BASI|nr:hypothetical protein [Austropuccinia psidii MF-1]